MDFSSGHEGRQQQIIDLFMAAFTASEGADEGASIGALVADMFRTTSEADMLVCCAAEAGSILGCIIFTRMRYDEDQRSVFVLAPVAVSTGRQGEGIGQRLLRYGLQEVRGHGADYVLTYGDPAYYAKVGFGQITEDFAAPPHVLSQPHGWLGQSLTDPEPLPLAGAGRCVPALDSPEYW